MAVIDRVEAGSGVSHLAAAVDPSAVLSKVRVSLSDLEKVLAYIKNDLKGMVRQGSGDDAGAGLVYASERAFSLAEVCLREIAAGAEALALHRGGLPKTGVRSGGAAEPPEASTGLSGGALADSQSGDGERAEQKAMPASSPPAIRGSQVAGLRFGDEQQVVVECDSPRILVRARAGTGKTTMLIGYAAARKRRRTLYLAFNRAVAIEGQSRFSSNVTSKTPHSLAYAAVGHKYQHKLGSPRARDVMDFLSQKSIGSGSDVDRYSLAQSALSLINDYFASASMEPDIMESDAAETYYLPSGRQLDGRDVARAAQAVWADMRDERPGTLALSHDGYLKLWHQQSPNLAARFDQILLDEGQDSSPLVLDVFKSQACGKVLVGDEHQSIYQFRGAINAMGEFNDATKFALTQSFRFGPEIANVANRLLGAFTRERLKLTGAGSGVADGVPSKARLYRTNAGLFGSAATWVDAKAVKLAAAGRDGFPALSEQAARMGCRGLHFVGGVKRYNFDAVADTYFLKSGNKYAVRDAFLKRFESFDHLVAYAETVKDKELLARIGIVDKFAERTPELVEKVKASHVEAPDALTSMTTAHGSKGLEWDLVNLGEDFPTLLNERGEPKTKQNARTPAEAEQALPIEELNLYYVASTRAKCQLVPNKALKEFLEVGPA